MNSLFLTNKKDYKNDSQGGVQICSMEFHNALSLAGFKLCDFYVDVSKKSVLRLKRKLKIDAYNLYDPIIYKDQLKSFIIENNISYVFINKSELVRFSKIIKEIDTNLKVVILSHGNETGDFLHMLTRPSEIHPIGNKLIKIFRLGYNLYIESFFRVKYVDTVFSLSQVESEIEKWLGVQDTLLIPRGFEPNFIDWKPDGTSVGFVGSLDHPPNYHGLLKLAENLLKLNSSCKIRVIGSPVALGKEFPKKYSNITYLGRLSNEELLKDMCTWSFFLNPVLWYSRGASTKLAVGVNAGMPIISSKAGNRGYIWKEGTIIECEKAHDMASFIDSNYQNFEQLQKLALEVRKVALSGPTEIDIANIIKEDLLQIKP